ncbi:hypothetical protein Tco_1313782 [Tanacetum coccineum]
MILGSLKKFKKRSPEELKPRSKDTRRTSGNTTRNDPFPPFLIIEAQTQKTQYVEANSSSVAAIQADAPSKQLQPSFSTRPIQLKFYALKRVNIADILKSNNRNLLWAVRVTTLRHMRTFYTSQQHNLIHREKSTRTNWYSTAGGQTYLGGKEAHWRRHVMYTESRCRQQGFGYSNWHFEDQQYDVTGTNGCSDEEDYGSGHYTQGIHLDYGCELMVCGNNDEVVGRVSRHDDVSSCISGRSDSLGCYGSVMMSDKKMEKCFLIHGG